MKFFKNFDSLSRLPPLSLSLTFIFLNKCASNILGTKEEERELLKFFSSQAYTEFDLKQKFEMKIQEKQQQQVKRIINN